MVREYRQTALRAIMEIRKELRMNYTTPTLIELTERERDPGLDWAGFAFEQQEPGCPLREGPK